MPSKSKISYAGRANRNLKNRLVLQMVKDRQAEYLYQSARCLRCLVKLPSRKAAAVSTLDLFLSDPALPRSGEVSEVEMLACLATLGDP